MCKIVNFAHTFKAQRTTASGGKEVDAATSAGGKNLAPTGRELLWPAVKKVSSDCVDIVWVILFRLITTGAKETNEKCFYVRSS